MTQSPALHQHNKQTQSLKQTQRMIMSPKMQQAIHLLQLPIAELAALIEAEIEQNPLLEYQEESLREEIEELSNDKEETDSDDPDREVTFDDDDFEVLKQLSDEYYDHFDLADSPSIRRRDSEEERLKLFLDSSITGKESLYQHLMRQVKENFNTKEEQLAAELLIGNFDANGFLGTPIDEIAATANIEKEKLLNLLAVIQTFDPVGVGACNLQESLLIQLRNLGKESSLAYKIIQNHYSDLLHNKIPLITKKLKCTPQAVKAAVQKDIMPLDLHPGLEYSRDPIQSIIPDLSIHEDYDGNLNIIILDDRVPTLRLNSKYIRMFEDPTLSQETKEFLKQKILSAKWLLHNLYQRNETLEKIANSLVAHQRAFFSEPDGALQPMTMKMIAAELNLHESTVARAVANKYVDTDRGLIALRSLFTHCYNTDEGEDLSSKTVRDLLLTMIEEEDKRSPLSDQALSLLLKEQGVPCARRTIAKYRKELQIGNAWQRREY